MMTTDLDTTFLWRTVSFVDAEKEGMVDVIHSRLNQLTARVNEMSGEGGGAGQTTIYNTTTSSGSGNTGTLGQIPETNNSSLVFVAGEVLGFSSGVLARATGAVATFVRATLVCTASSRPGRDLFFASGGVVNVKTESGVTITKGDLAWISDTTAGTVTPTQPTGGSRQQKLGTFMDTGDVQAGMAKVMMQLDLSTSR